MRHQIRPWKYAGHQRAHAHIKLRRRTQTACLHPNRTRDLKNQKPIESPKVSQKEKDKYRILTHIYGISKNGTKELIYGAAMEKQT